MNYTISIWLKNIRRMRGLTLDEVSQRLNGMVTKQAISKYERGLMKPSSTVMDALCKLYQASPDFLLGRKPVSLSDLSFRSKEPISQKLKQRILSQVQIWMEHYLALENLFDAITSFRNPVHGLSIADFDDMENAAIQVRRKWGLGNDTIASVCRILELVGIKVLELEIEEDVDGLCGWVNKKTPFIVLKKNNVTVERKRFTALHELAHILFPCLDEMDYKKKERMCHRFASAILLPKEVVYTYVGRVRDNLSVSELSSLRGMYGVSVAAIVHRLRDLNVISVDYYNHIFDDRIKQNPLEEGWGAYPLIDNAVKYKSLMNRAVVEGYMEGDGQGIHIDKKYKVDLGEIEIM
ncbi:XRE family transcriptional regulator [uncultured Bacteroides sp.]|uniref:helix-turn-helix domain-containing protein n=1 Tax=uncultured Bacteroides sp. TaxID=162156 RepID=UPI00261C3201|nr:XRE family transcriptional regulator [uncultured Bacteroides sp.]